MVIVIIVIVNKEEVAVKCSCSLEINYPLWEELGKSTPKMRLTICWIKLSENSLHICVATEIWETPRSNQAGWAITCAEPQLQYDPRKRNLDFNQVS